MQTGHVSTPFGRRPMTLGMLADQIMTADMKGEQSIDKWKLFRMLCDAKPLLGVTDRALAVVNALLSFYPHSQLSNQDNLVVFPSNAQLSLRTHGMAETTLRRHLAALVESGLLLRKDSPNGKRYARKDRAGDIDEAFGFSLAPLVSRHEEIARLADQVLSERQAVQRLRERISLCRRDIVKLIETSIEEGAPGDWLAIHTQFRQLVVAVPRQAPSSVLIPMLDDMELLREEILNRLKMQIKSQKTDGNDSQTGRHIQNSNTQITPESEPASEKKQGENQEISRRSPTPTIFPLNMVLQACPEISVYGPGGAVTTWRDMMSAAVVVRSMLGVSPSAYQDACDALGPEGAATVIACILERGGHINSAGGYLRNLTRRAEQGEFSLGPMVMALFRANSRTFEKAG